MGENTDRIRKIFSSKNRTVGEIIHPYPYNSKVGQFLEFVFGKFRINVIKVNNNNREELFLELKKFCEYKNIDFEVIDASKVYDSEYVRGSIVIDEEKLSYSRNKPVYWPKAGRDKMIVVDNLSEKTDLEILRAFLHVSRKDYELNAFEDSIPLGSGFVFIADEFFPFEKFRSISNIWYQETRTLEY